MIRIIPARPLRSGENTHLYPPDSHLRKLYLDFIERNRDYHKPWVYHPKDPKHFEAYLKRIKRGITQGCFIFNSANDKLVGICNINNILLGSIRSASLGYYADRQAKGTGLMAEGMALVLDYAVREIGLHRLEANIQPDNLPSIALVKKLGFHKEGFSPKYLQIGGQWCDHERWAILDDDIERKNN